MSKKRDMTLTATKFRIILTIGMLLIIVVGSAGFLASKDWLKSYAVDVSKQRVDANASDGNLETLQVIQQELAQQQNVLTKANLLKSTNEFPEFQIVDIVSKTASENKISVASFAYIDGSQPASGGGAATPAPSTTPASPEGAPAAASSGKKVGITVTLGTPVKLQRLLQFMYDIEQNVPKMQISGVSLTPADKGSGVNVDPLTIEMFVK